LAGSKVTGNIGGNAATATALATARTIAGVSFDGTANIAIPSSGLSDSSDIVRGASSVASGQVLYGTGAGVAGSNANFVWDTVNNRLRIGGAVVGFAEFRNASNVATSFYGTALGFMATGGASDLGFRATNAILFATNGDNERARFAATTGNLLLGTTTDDGANRLQVAGGIKGGGYTIDNGAAFGATDPILYNSGLATLANYAFSQNGTGETVFNGLRIDFRTGNNNRLRVAAATGNIIVGGTTDNNFRLDIASSGSSGTLRAYDQTPTTGTTQVIVRAGAGQSTTNLTTWQNSSGTAQSRVNVNGGVESAVFLAVASSTSFTGYRLVLGTAQLEIGSAVGLNFSSSTEATATKDAGLARNAAGVVEINSGTAGTFRDLYLRGVRPVGSTVANLPTASGNTGMMATVTDATVTTIGTTVAGGGGNTVLVWSNGTNWRIYAN
jgi:hypothetical protein